MSRVLFTALFAMGFSVATLAQDTPPPNVTLTDVDGRVSVNQGDEFVPAKEGMRLKPGDRVMVQDNGKAELKFDDECEQEVKENSIATIPDKSPCDGGAMLVQNLTPTGGEAIGAAGATGTGNGGVGWMVAIVTAIDLWWLNEDDHDVVSP